MSETIHSIGRRKTSVARIYLKKGKGAVTVNDKNYTQYFPTGSKPPFELAGSLYGV